jgi:hypothetical protein
MASLVIDTGVATHPQISIDTLDLRNGVIGFRWVGGVYTGDCAEPFVLSIAEHGDKTVAEVVASITAEMVSKLPLSE